MEYLLKMIKNKENFEISTPSLSTSSLSGSSIPEYAYLGPITDKTRITNDTLDAVIKIMKSQNARIDAMKDTTNLSIQLKQAITEEEGQYYINNKQFPIDPFVLGYLKYATETDEYKQKIEDTHEGPSGTISQIMKLWFDPKLNPNRFFYMLISSQFPSLFPTIKRITDNWQYPDTPSTPSEQLFSKDGYDIGGGTVFKCQGPGNSQLFKSTNIGKPDETGSNVIDLDKLPDEIPYFEFVDKENPCNPCIMYLCPFKIAGSSPPLFQALWGIQPTSVELDKNTSTNSFSGFDAATAKGTGTDTTETKKEDPAVTASDQNKQVAQNDADAKKAQLDVELKQTEVDNAKKSTWEKTFG